MIAFVAGATGYTGRAVVAELAKRGIPTTAHVRPGSPGKSALEGSFSETEVSILECEWTAHEMEQALEQIKPDLVFALLGTTSRRAKREGITGDIYQQVEGRLTSMLLDATAKCSPNARFVFLSSLGTKEDSKNRYLKVRAELERSIEASGVAYTIARPSFITGTDREEFRAGERIAARAADALLGVAALFGAESARDRWGSLTAVKLAHALVTAAMDPGCENRVLETEELRRLSL